MHRECADAYCLTQITEHADEEEWTEDFLGRMIKGTMRKLAREAIIFALLGLLAGAIGMFVVLDMEDRADAKAKAVQAVHAVTLDLDTSQPLFDMSKAQPILPPGVTEELIAVQVPLMRKGTVLQVRRCSTADPGESVLRSARGIDDTSRANLWDVFHQAKNEDELATRLQNANIPQSLKADLWDAKRAANDPWKVVSERPAPLPVDLSGGLVPKNCRNFSNPFRDVLPLGNPDQVAIEKDYWTAYKNSRHQQFGSEILGSLFIGLWGFPAGIALWIFYRLVRFALKG